MSLIHLCSIAGAGHSFTETDLSLTNLKKTSFVNAYISTVVLDGAKLNLTDFRGAEIQRLNIKTQNLTGAILTPQQLKMLAEEIGITVLDIAI